MTKQLFAGLGLAAMLMFQAAPVLAQHGHDDHGAAEHGHDDHGHEHGAAAEAHGDAHADGHGDHSISMGAIFSDGKFLGSLVNFGVFLGLLVYFGKKPINAALARRRQDIQESLEEAQKLKAEAEAKRDEYAKRLEKLDSEMEQIRADMIRAGESERDRIVKEAEHKAALLRKDTKFQIEQQFKQLRDDLTREAVEAAIVAAEETLTKSTSAADQTRLGEQYLEAIAEQAKKNGAVA